MMSCVVHGETSYHGIRAKTTSCAEDARVASTDFRNRFLATGSNLSPVGSLQVSCSASVRMAPVRGGRASEHGTWKGALKGAADSPHTKLPCVLLLLALLLLLLPVRVVPIDISCSCASHCETSCHQRRTEVGADPGHTGEPLLLPSERIPAKRAADHAPVTLRLAAWKSRSEQRSN